MYLCKYMCMCVQEPADAISSRFPGHGVTGGCGPPDMGA